MPQFTHLHVHTQFSVLDGMSKIDGLVKKCQKSGMNSIAITDHGCMYGIKQFVDVCKKLNKGPKGEVKTMKAELAKAKEEGADAERITELENAIETAQSKIFKPIIGCEAYCARRTLYDKDKDFKIINAENGKEQVADASGYHLVLLAKNAKGYENLCKLISIAWVDGFYHRPRIDKNILKQYSEGLIVSSACLGGEIPQLIIAGKTDEAEKSIMWFKEIFGDDYYLEIQRHKTDKLNADRSTFERQQQVNKVILELAAKTNTKVIATNDVHFVDEEHADAHDMLICLSTGKDYDDPSRMRYTKQEWLKTPEEMAEIFADIPEALENTIEITNKIETYDLDRGPLMPVFDIPEEFGTEEEYRQKYTHEDLFNEFTRNEVGEVVLSEKEANDKIEKLGGYDRLYRIKLEGDYLRKLALDGAKKRYGDPLSDEVMERIIFELHIMKTMGFPGYFLIVQDFIAAAREMGVSVGPGRGSAAGSVVAYCLKITDIDPLEYDLLFERFLNPDRISLPDIDIDFDDEGRGKILRWVTEKYGAEKVAHIITYGTMATKSSIKDVGRIMKVPLPQVNSITNLVPDKFTVNDPDTNKEAKVNVHNCIRFVPEIKDIFEGRDRSLSEMLHFAEILEGTVRQTGIHACGVIIGADDLKKFAPLSTAKDKDTGEDVLVTQYEGKVIEDVGLIKMDFLGLRNLSIIKEALRNIKKSQNVDIDIDNIPKDDKKTYELFSAGQTIGTFQFESPGMQKHLKDLKPTVFEDLIAMNALYRPGPMQYIPQFIARKHGREPIVYDIDCTSKYLSDTYGITVYQEQVMLLSRQLANFTRGESDTLRKAMGKKQIDKLNELEPKFLKQGEANGHNPEILKKIWADWKEFAKYAFNKSHATCYTWVAYQTAYLKAHYPAEYMAANLTCNLDDISSIKKFMSECQTMKLVVKGPDVNESHLNFSVNTQQEIRFGLGGIKGVGRNAVETIINEREKNGLYKSIFDFVERVNLSACNKKTIEALAMSGAFDCFDNIMREQYFTVNSKNEQTLDAIIRYGTAYQNDKNRNQLSLFDMMDDAEIPHPVIPKAEEWTILDKLSREEEYIGVYLSAHPLDKYRAIIKYATTHKTNEVDELKTQEGASFTVAGIVSNTRNGITRTGNPYGILTLQDYEGTYEFPLFGQDYVKFGSLLMKDIYIMIKGAIQEKGADWKFKPKQEPGKPKELVLKVNSIELIDDNKKNMLETLTINLQLCKLESGFIQDLHELIEENPGKSQLYIRVSDPETRTNIKLHSKAYSVDINNALITALESYRDSEYITFKIN